MAWQCFRRRKIERSVKSSLLQMLSRFQSFYECPIDASSLSSSCILMKQSWVLGVEEYNHIMNDAARTVSILLLYIWSLGIAIVLLCLAMGRGEFFIPEHTTQHYRTPRDIIHKSAVQDRDEAPF